MTIYQQLLLYYLHSERYFENYLIRFFQEQGHCGECTTSEESYKMYCDTVDSNIQKYYYESEICTFCKAKELKENGYQLSLPDSTIKHYFTSNYYDEQLFSIVFAHWYGLSENQIHQVANKRNKKYAEELLHFFICNPDKDTPEVSLNELDYRLCNHGTYKIYLENETVISARYDNGMLIRDNTNQPFWIL